jgi:hypothetical protein
VPLEAGHAYLELVHTTPICRPCDREICIRLTCLPLNQATIQYHLRTVWHCLVTSSCSISSNLYTLTMDAFGLPMSFGKKAAPKRNNVEKKVEQTRRVSSPERDTKDVWTDPYGLTG